MFRRVIGTFRKTHVVGKYLHRNVILTESIISIRRMAIVNRKVKEPLFLLDSADNLGPGSYNIDDKLVHRSPKYFSIYKSKHTDSKKGFNTPGPGHYDLPESCPPQKILLCDENEGLIVVEKQNLQANFKSKTRKNMTLYASPNFPGPGSYDIDKPRSQKQKFRGHQKGQANGQTTSVLQQLLSNLGYRPTATIPHKSDEKQFFVEEEGEMKLCNIRILHSGQNNRQAKRNISQYLKPGNSFSKASCPRVPQPEFYDNLGPGCYFTEPEVSKPKKTQYKSVEERRGSFTKLLDAQDKLKNQISQFTQDSEDNISTQYIKDSVPGPGSYDTNVSMFGSKNNAQFSKNKGFGALEKRFAQTKVSYGCSQSRVVGDRQVKKIKKSDVPCVAFGRKREEVEKSEEAYRKLGPGSYLQTQSMSRKLLTNLKKSYQGSFGSTIDRFKFIADKSDAADFYEVSNTIASSKPNITNCVFKSSSQRECFDLKSKSQTQNQGFYSQKYKTIEKAAQDMNTQLQEGIVRKPGFNMSTVRFVDKVKEETPFRKTDKLNPAQSFAKTCANPKAYSIPIASFRDEKVLDDNPGPGEYRDSDKWNTRTFNVLYL